jgi:hypothetical protein
MHVCQSGGPECPAGQAETEGSALEGTVPGGDGAHGEDVDVWEPEFLAGLVDPAEEVGFAYFFFFFLGCPRAVVLCVWGGRGALVRLWAPGGV